MGVDLGGLHVAVPHQLLHGPDVVTGLQQVGGKAVAQGMGRRRLAEAGGPHRLLERPLDPGGIDMVPFHPARNGVDRTAGGRKKIPPAGFRGRVRVLTRARSRQRDLAIAVGKIGFPDPPRLLDLLAHTARQRFGGYETVLGPLPAADHHLPVAEVQVLYPQPQALGKPQTRPVHQARHQPVAPAQAGEDARDLVPGEHDRYPGRPLGLYDVVDPLDLDLEHLLVKEGERAERLVLGGSGDVPDCRQVGEKCADLCFTHLGRVPLAMKQDEPLDPAQIGILCAEAVVPYPNRPAHLLQKWGGALSMAHVTNPPWQGLYCTKQQYPSRASWATLIIGREPGYAATHA
jgi:hypothetical protein